VPIRQWGVLLTVIGRSCSLFVSVIQTILAHDAPLRIPQLLVAAPRSHLPAWMRNVSMKRSPPSTASEWLPNQRIGSRVARPATASVARKHGVPGKRPAQSGDTRTVTGRAGGALCIIEAGVVEVTALEDRAEDLVSREGEGDGTVATARRRHAACFNVECERVGRERGPRMPVGSERVRTVYPSRVGKAAAG